MSEQPQPPPPTEKPPARHVLVVRGPLALLAARLDGLPPGEYVITLDKTHQRRPRWKIGGQPAGWEKAHREDATE